MSQDDLVSRQTDNVKTSRARIFGISAAVLLVVGVAFVIAVVRPGLQRTLVMATGPAGSTYAQYGEQYRLLLARHGIELRLRASGGTVENLRLLGDPTAGIDVAFLSAGATSAEESPDLSALGTVFLEELWFFTCDSDLRGGELTMTRGKRISIGPEGSATRSVARALISLNGVDPASAEFVGLAPREAAEQLRHGDIDAAFIVTSADSPIIKELLADPSIDLVNFRRAGAYVARYPFLTQLTVPEGVGDLRLNRPPLDVTTLGAPVSLAVRADLYPALQAVLLEAARQIHAGPGMFNAAGRFPSPQAIDLPLSNAATQYYQSGVPFLQRYLPFGLAVMVGQLLFIVIPLVGVLYPALRIAPGLYGWFMRRHIFRLYGELKFLEKDLDSDTGNERRQALRTQLKQLDHRVERKHVPVSYAPLVYTLRMHIDLIRSRL